MRTTLLTFLLILSASSFLHAQQGKKYVPGQLILELDASQNIEEASIKSTLNRIGIKSTVYLGFNRYYLIRFSRNRSLDSMITILSEAGIRSTKDELIPFAGEGTIQTNDALNDLGYWNSANQNFLPAKSNMDSLLAFLPPLYKNNSDDPEEKITLIHTEIPRLTHYDMPAIDSFRSVDLLRGAIPIDGANATPHGSWTGGVAYAKWHNAQQPAGFDGGMTGMTNNKRPIILNIADANSGSSSATISMLYWCYNYCQTYPDRRLVISFSFAGSYMPQPIAAQIEAQNKILLIHSAGNSNVPAFNYVDAFQLNTMASSPNGQKASFSNYGQFIDIAFQGSSMKGLSPASDAAIDNWQGTSASAPGVAGGLVTLWNLMPTKMASEMKSLLVHPLNTTHFIIQPDGSAAKPVIRFWYLLGNIIFPLATSYANPLSIKTTPTTNLNTLVNDLIGTQSNRKFYWRKGNTWVEFTSGIANWNELGSGRRQIKYQWTNSQTTGSDGQNTQSEVIRTIELYNTKPLYQSGITYCINQPEFKIKLLNCPETSSLDTLKIFQGSADITNTFNRNDSTFTISPGTSSSVSVKVIYYKKDNIAIADSTESLITGTNTPQVLTNNITSTSFIPCEGPYASFTASSNAVQTQYQWKKNGVNVGTNSPVYTDSSLVNGQQITCTVIPYNGCWTAASLQSNIVNIAIPPCTDNLNNNSIGTANLINYQNSFCDGEANFNGTPVSADNYPVIRYQKSSWIPKQGTIEMLVKVTNGYSSFFGISTTSATLLAIDSNGLDKSSFIAAYSNGNISFRRYNPATQSFTDVTATGTPFRFNQWHVISVSYGSNGTVIRVNGITYVTNSTVITPMHSGNGFLGGSNFSDGANWWGIYGFKGQVDKIRFSYSQSDWQMALPNQPPTASISASPTLSCSGDPITFTATTNAPTANYQWKKNSVNVGTNTAIYVDNTITNGTNISCVITATSGCFSTPSAISNTIFPLVNERLTPGISISATKTNPCAGETVVFSATITNGGVSPLFQWRRNGIPVGTGSSYTSNTLNTNDVLTCALTSSLTCVTTPTATSNSIIITVRPIITPTVNITANSTTICEKTQVTFVANTNVVSPTFQWKINGVPAGQNSNQLVSSSLSNNDQITCTVIAPSTDCYTNYTQVSNSIQMKVNPLLVPAIQIISNDADNTLCAGETISFSTTITNGGIQPHYQWKRNGLVVGTDSPTLTITSPKQNDEITCVLTSSETCVTSTVAESNLIRLKVVSLKPVITKNGFTLEAVGTHNGAIIQWWKNGQPIIGANQLRLKAIEFGSYSISENFQNCSATSNTILLEPVTGNKNEEVRLFPNPGNGLLYAQTTSINDIIKTVRVYDINGNIVFFKQIVPGNLVELNLQHLSNAVYLVEFETNQKKTRLKYMKM